jgi:aminoglycoside phosphotransferase family enzyme/predicted kinase
MDHSVESQDAVFRFLGDAKTHDGCEVRRIDTHAAAVFLAGKRAYKVKRAVRFPFLDYSTLAKRKHACLAELDVNQAFAPELYRGVVAITQTADGQLAVNGDDEPIEYAVEMVRFDESQTFDRLADAGTIDDALADRLAVTVAAMHARASIAESSSWLAALTRYIDQNTAAFREHPALFQPDNVATLDQASHAALVRLRPLLLHRGSLGLIRRGHGDLHLGNVALVEGRPVPFDAIEFDPVIATGDVLYDLAFLLMDLVERRIERAANIILNRYFAESHRLEDCDGLAALPFFMSLRAAIRANVTAARLANVDAAEQPGIRQAAQTYFRLAIDLLSPPPPTLIAIGGLSGTGKSLLARSLAPFVAPAPGALVLRSDTERKHLFGVEETEHLPAVAYQADATAKVYRILAEKADHTITARHSAIVDAVFANVDERTAIAAAAASANVAFRGLFLVADLKTRLARVRTRTLDASDADTAVVRQQEAFALGNVAWMEIDASGTPAETLTRARAAIG